MAQRTAAGELMVIEVVTSCSGIPSKRISISASESTATPPFLTSPPATGWSHPSPHKARRRHPALPHRPTGHRMNRVEPQQGGQVKGDRQTSLPLRQEIPEPLIRGEVGK